MTRNPADRPRDRRHRRGSVDPGVAIPARSAIPTPAPGSPMPRSPKSPTPLSHPPRTGSPPGWWCAGSRTPATPTRCSRCGGITRSSPTPTCPSTQADITHRQHAIIETVFADLIDGPLAHIPSGRFGANSAWVLCAAIAHNLLRAAGVLAGDRHTRARGSTLRRRIVNVPARLARPQRRPILHLPTHWPWSKALACTVAQHHRIQPTTARDTLTTRRTGPTGAHRKSWTDQQTTPRPHPDNQDQQTPTPVTTVRRWIEAKGRTGKAQAAHSKRVRPPAAELCARGARRYRHCGDHPGPLRGHANRLGTAGLATGRSKAAHARHREARLGRSAAGAAARGTPRGDSHEPD